MECFLCLDANHNFATCIQVDSKQWQEFSIKTVIDKHLWPIESLTTNSYICSSCWKELNDFHKFYTHIEEIHNCSTNKWLLTTETDPLEEDVKPNDLAMEDQLEMEIEFGQKLLMSTLIKQENEELTVGLLTEDRDKDDVTIIYENCLDGDLNLMGVEHMEESITKAESKLSGEKDNDEKVTQESYNDDYNTGRILHRLSRISREEYDAFLKEHFKITCDKCQQPFERFRLLMQHFKKEHNELGYVKRCETKFFNRMQLVDHINCHLNPEYFKCVQCGKVFPKRTYLLDHMKKVHEVKTHRCDICGKKFGQKYNLDKHILRHMQQTQKKEKMRKKEKEGKTKSKSGPTTDKLEDDDATKNPIDIDIDTAEKANHALRKLYHLSLNNSDECDQFIIEHFKITCYKCDKIFENFHRLSQHCRREYNEPGYVVCCEKKMLSRMELFDHLNYHLNPEYFKCVHCDKTFAKRTYLLDHMKFHEERKYSCDVCHKKFVREKILEKHKLIHGERTVQCKDCGKFYVNEDFLNQHQRQHHLNVYARICDVCGQKLPDNNTFKLHMKKHDGTEEDTSVKCDICGRVVKTQKTLRLHKQLQHPEGGSRDYNCHICPKVSPTMRALKRHIVEVHESVHKYNCTVCDKAFKRQRQLQSHMATHTGIPLYRCPWCPKEFNSNGNFHKHRQKVHPVEWEEDVRKRYSGNLPPNFKRPSTHDSQQTPLSNDVIQK